VGPDYKRPSTPIPPAYKEQGDQETLSGGAQWKPAEPKDQARRGKWWEVFGDPVLDALEDQIDVSNLNIAQAEAQFRSARATVRGARADFYPLVTASASVTRAKTSANIRNQPGTVPVGTTTTTYQLPVDVSYEVDVWGRIRRNVESSVAAAQASAADLETVRLSMHAELAADYFLLRGQDAQKQLLDSNVTAYEKALELTLNRYNQGVVSGIDVAQAQTQLETTRAQATDLGVFRAQLEHAIGTLIGKTPAEFTIEPVSSVPVPPDIPAGLPSELLERRPDVAAAERRVAAANAQIGVAIAAYFPKLLLAAAGGYESSKLSTWFSIPSRFWSVGPELAATLFDGGKRRATTEQARASYDASVAVYRLQALTAFQDVEDNLAALRILTQEAAQQAAAVEAAERSLTLARNRYTAGITTYLEVITAQALALADEKVANDILTRRLTAAVNLVKALGGGWSDADLPYGAPPAPPPAEATAN
jgi:NodT family efflux transporter outer membrane factor (OMF) lipoprotein